ncbi:MULTISPECIES: hypothetical protein [unclassified Kitasatospora]|uniref:hypothetical protein n=1 Tax=unclassified Kitasatospora TaxID=2633591 RepID=UPI00070F9C38|nr:MULTISPECIES: hypothetical protein [unclassified Kitasatospora]KQV05617.1 hypothetical protein ASC99_12490 [Kitasatospora sp. Root107]KRB62420.1 hypothetical protein ASE03_07440 [Kitasatospora sp. Root187]
MIIRDLVAAVCGLPAWPHRISAAGRRPVAVAADLAALAWALPWWPAHAAASGLYLLAAVRLWRLARRGSARTRAAAADLARLTAGPLLGLAAVHAGPALLRFLLTH